MERWSALWWVVPCAAVSFSLCLPLDKRGAKPKVIMDPKLEVLATAYQEEEEFTVCSKVIQVPGTHTDFFTVRRKCDGKRIAVQAPAVKNLKEGDRVKLMLIGYPRDKEGALSAFITVIAVR